MTEIADSPAAAGTGGPAVLRPAAVPGAGQHGCADGCCPTSSDPAARDTAWWRSARLAVLLSWASLAWMSVEGGVGLYAGSRAGSPALLGWALSSAVEGLAAIIVIWRFTGRRVLSPTSERTAQRAVAVSFWLLAPYIAVQSAGALLARDRPTVTVLGMALAGSSVLVMPALGRAKQRLGARLGSAATAGEGIQNLLCAVTGGAVLLGLAGNALLGAWWFDPPIGLLVAAVAVREGRSAWRGQDCC